ncbi:MULTISPECIES: acyl carrier protein [Streptomyces]|uniref:Acyl carrier protein n=1 Tax=Streptomyces lichenis TaxID=2306967 RepID=A0ABT0IA28_9ACTN|nr:acyl carrier protein [Streptomyces lichenis]MCK8678137.1 acyl carrier protein [Streptomyces lichenis]
MAAPMLSTVIDILTRQAALPAGPVTPTATLTEAGVDSMAVAVLAMVLEEDHGLVFTETVLSGQSTVAELAAYIESHRAAAA